MTRLARASGAHHANHVLSSRDRIRRLAGAVALASVLAPAGGTSAGAQLRADAELGGAQVSQSSFPGRSAATVQGLVEYLQPSFTVFSSGSVTLPASERLRVHGLLGGAVRTPDARRFAGEVGAYGSIYNDNVFPTAVSGLASARVRMSGRRALVWAGVGAGALDDGVNEYPLRLVEAGGAAGTRAFRITGSVTLHDTRGEPRTEFTDDPEPIAVTVRDPITYTDVVLTPRLVRGPFELEARGGLRLVQRTIAFEPRERRPFGSIDAAWWVTPRVAFVAAAGRELADLARGLPDTRYLTLAVRARLQGASPRSVVSPPPPRRVQGAAPDVLIERGGAAGPVLRVLTGADAQQVEVAGTFTGWEPVALDRAGTGAWTCNIVLPTGPHRLMLRVDGGPWMPPANLPRLEDEELGGAVGIVTIP